MNRITGIVKSCGRSPFTRWIFYTALFVLIALWIFDPFLLRGYSLVSLGDGYDQYYPTLVYIGTYGREFFANLLSGTIRQFDFTIGLGDDVVGTLSYYGFGDPLNWLAVFVQPQDTAYLYSFLIVLRWYLAGLAFLWYTRRRGIAFAGGLLGALFYAFCPYVLYYNLLFAAGYGNALMLLPLILGGMDEILDHPERWFSGALAAGIFLLSLCGYYFLYITGLFLIIYFTVRYLTGRLHAGEETAGGGHAAPESLPAESSRRHCGYVRSALPALVSSFAGMAAGAAILLPSVGYFLQSSRSGETSISLSTLFSLYESSYYIDALTGLFLPSEENVFGFPILLLPALVVLIRRKGGGGTFCGCLGLQLQCTVFRGPDTC